MKLNFVGTREGGGGYRPSLESVLLGQHMSEAEPLHQSEQQSTTVWYDVVLLYQSGMVLELTYWR